MVNRPGRRLKVVLNGFEIPVKTFADYISFYDGVEEPIAFEEIADCDRRWQIGVAKSESGSFEQIR